MTRHEKGGAPPQIPWKQALWKLFVGGMALLVLTVSAWGDEIEYDITEELEEIGAEELYGQLPSETQQLLEEFGIEPGQGHIINGHIPVKSKASNSLQDRYVTQERSSSLIVLSEGAVFNITGTPYCRAN